MTNWISQIIHRLVQIGATTPTAATIATATTIETGLTLAMIIEVPAIARTEMILVNKTIIDLVVMRIAGKIVDLPDASRRLILQRNPLTLSMRR